MAPGKRKKKKGDRKKGGIRRTDAAAPARVQTGVRIERRLLKVLKALAEYHDLTLGELLEQIVLHSLEGRSPFDTATLQTVDDLKGVYGMDQDTEIPRRIGLRPWSS